MIIEHVINTSSNIDHRSFQVHAIGNAYDRWVKPGCIIYLACAPANSMTIYVGPLLVTNADFSYRGEKLGISVTCGPPNSTFGEAPTSFVPSHCLFVWPGTEEEELC
jgi:hypothetical protein